MFRQWRERQIQRSPFFSKHPYSGKLSLQRVDGRNIVDHDLKIFFTRIPKNANSSLTDSLNWLKTGQFSESQKLKRRLKVGYQNLSNLNDSEVQSFFSYTKLLFVRNPYARVLSAFLSKVDKRRRITLDGKKVLSPRYAFSEFCRWLKSEGLYANQHWAPQHEFLPIPLSGYDFVGRVETLDEDFSAFCRMIGKPAPPRVSPEARGHETNASSKIDRYYDGETFDIVAEIYEKDFTLFGYDIK
jgi:hypothetical protein